MKKILVLSAVIAFVIACHKTPWVGKYEFITVKYSNSQQSGPVVSVNPYAQSRYVEVSSISTANIGNNTVQVVLDGVRVKGLINNYEIDNGKIKIYEKKSSGNWEEQSEFNSISSSTKSSIACVLVLDMSSSLSDVMSNLKSYAKDFIDQITSANPNSMVGVVFFSGKNDMFKTSFFNASNKEVLKTLIDNYSNFKDRTALFQATLEGISMLDSLALGFNGPKSLVVFTDGGDNDTDNPDDALAKIKNSAHLRFSIGLDGKDFVKEDVKSIASENSNFERAKDNSDLQDIFSKFARQVASVYTISYNRSDQLIDDIQIKFEFEVIKIKN